MGKRKIKKNLENKSTVDISKQETTSENMYKSFFIIIAAIIVIFGGTYGLMAIFMEDEQDDITETEEYDYLSNIGYENILAQDSFDQKDDDYVVIFVNGEEGKTEANRYFGAKSMDFESKIPPAYIVTMNEKVNKKYMFDNSEEEEKYGIYASSNYNKEPKSVKDLEINEFPTMIRITKGKFAGYYEGDEFYEEFDITNPDDESNAQNGL